MDIIWLSSAWKSLYIIYDFHAEFNTGMARKLYNSILSEIDILLHFPYVGQLEISLSHFNLEFRYLLVVKGRFKVIYEVENTVIYIYTIFDCRQNPETLKQNVEPFLSYS